MPYEVEDFKRAALGYSPSEEKQVGDDIEWLYKQLKNPSYASTPPSRALMDTLRSWVLSWPKKKKKKKKPKPISTKVEIKVSGNTVSFSGLMPFDFTRNMRICYGTSKISHIFLEKNARSFHVFFALEVYKILTDLQADTIYTEQVSDADKLRYKNAARLLEEHTWLKTYFKKEVDPVLNRKMLKNLNITLFKHQQELLDVYDNIVPRMGLRGMLIAATPGSGKTILSLAMAECIEADKVIIICPLATVNSVWEKTIQEVFKREQRWWSSTCGRTPSRNDKYFIIHYEYRDKFFRDIKSLGLNRKKVSIILDESHNLNDMKSQRTKNYLALVDMLNPIMVLPMSGTPLKAASGELIPTLRAIDARFNEKVMNSYKKAFGGSITGATALVRDRIEKMTYVVTKEEIDVPPPEKMDVYVEVPDSERFTTENIKAVLTEYIKEKKLVFAETAKDDKKVFLEILEKARRNADRAGDEAWLYDYEVYLDNVLKIIETNFYKPLIDEMAACNAFEKNKLATYLDKEYFTLFKLIKTQVKYVELKVVGMAIGNVLTRIRTEAHVAMVQQANLGDMIDTSLSKTICFFTSVAVGDMLSDILTEKGYKPAKVFGEYAKNRNTEVKAFAEDGKIDPLLASFNTLGTGIPLTMASTMVICELPYRDYILQQAIARIARIGQLHPTRTIFLILDTGDVPNISTRSRDIIAWANQQVEIITGIEVESALTEESIFANPETPCFLDL